MTPWLWIMAGGATGVALYRLHQIVLKLEAIRTILFEANKHRLDFLDDD